MKIIYTPERKKSSAKIVLPEKHNVSCVSIPSYTYDATFLKVPDYNISYSKKIGDVVKGFFIAQSLPTINFEKSKQTVKIEFMSSEEYHAIVFKEKFSPDIPYTPPTASIDLVDIVGISQFGATINVSIVTKTGIELDTNPGFSNPIRFEIDGCANSVDVSGLEMDTQYYVRGYIVKDGSTIYSNNVLEFRTLPSILPAELQGCEWLQSDTNSAILLDYIVKANTIIKTKVNKIGASLNTALFGSRNQWNHEMWELLINTQDKYGIALNNMQSATVLNNVQTSGTTTIEFGNGNIKINSYEGTIPTYSNRNSQNLALFSCMDRSQGKILSPTYEAQMHYCQIQEDDELKIDLYPCYVKIDKVYENNKGIICPAGTCGMYDVIGSLFYTNAGTGIFTHGADINI